MEVGPEATSAPRVAEVMATLETMGRAWKVENTDRYAA